MAPQNAASPRLTWEEAIKALRDDPQHRQLIFDSYLTQDLFDNCDRFARSAEFAEVLRLIQVHAAAAEDVLDIPAGNGIATHAFAAAGFRVTAVEPDSSPTVGRGAIRAVLQGRGLHARIIDAYGESLPLSSAEFDVVFVRQGLHHASDLACMLREYFRVLRPGGSLLACREHVVDNRAGSLQAFLNAQPDHQLYGGENAFTLDEYRSAIASAGFQMRAELDPYSSHINLHPDTIESLGEKILRSPPGRALRLLLSEASVIKLGFWGLKRARLPGRLYTFLAVKPG
jgi:SAM-dependent methyltransferase